MKRNTMKDEAKQIEAHSRNEYYQSLTLQQRLDRLDSRLGPGVGAERERKKIAKLMAVAAEAAKPKPEKPKAKQDKKGSKK